MHMTYLPPHEDMCGQRLHHNSPLGSIMTDAQTLLHLGPERHGNTKLMLLLKKEIFVLLNNLILDI